MHSTISIPEKGWFSTAEVADILGVSTTSVINYSRRSGLNTELIRRRRGDYVFTYYQVETLIEFAFAFDKE